MIVRPSGYFLTILTEKSLEYDHFMKKRKQTNGGREKCALNFIKCAYLSILNYIYGLFS